ncbi:MAG: helix-turn-helix domain-containing protein [Pseudobdellovibrio sp.]
MKTQKETDTPKNSTNLMDIKELAALLNVKESWVRSKIFDGTLKPLKLGRHVRFDRNTIDKWLADIKIGVECK